MFLHFFCFHDFLRSELFWGFGSFCTSLLCIVGELAGGGSVAVAVGVTDRLQVKGDMRHMPSGMCHVTRDT